MISIIIPTYNETENLKVLIPHIKNVLNPVIGKDFEILVMDDDSPDGTADYVKGLSDPLVRVVNRRGRKRGLAAAVIDGFKEAKGTTFVVMDADCSHPPQVLPPLISAIRNQGKKLAVASRYVPGGGTSHWPLKRRLISRFACALGRIVTPVKDCTSGYFCVEKSALQGVKLDSLGFKIGLEVIVKARHEGQYVEIPYVFSDRTRGVSKFGTGVILSYLKQLWKLKTAR